MKLTLRLLIPAFLMFCCSIVFGQTSFDYNVTSAKGGAFGGTIESFSFGVSQTKDAAGKASGKQSFGALIIVKKVDVNSPLLFQAVASNEVMKNVRIQVKREGEAKANETVALENAVVSEYKQYPSKGSNSEMMEEIGFTYQKITFANDTKSAIDNWETVH